jgi:hypothetical protein
MSYRLWSMIGLAGIVGGAGLPLVRNSDVDDRGMRVGAVTWQSAGAMTFGPDGTLFIADSKGGKLYALRVEDSRVESRDTGRFAVGELDTKVAAALGTTPRELRFNDMAVNKATGNIFLTVSRGLGDGSAPALVKVNLRGEVSLVDVDRIRFSETVLPAQPSRDGKTPWGQPQWMLSVTDLNFVDGELWVAGLSNEQFASALRRVPFPFSSSGALTTVEIYHTSHDKWETAAPIEAFLPISINGRSMILAGYGCAPLATFNTADIKSKKHLRGRTIAEMGGGNRPIDIISFENNGRTSIIVANSHRTMMKFDGGEVAGAPEMTTPVDAAYKPGGVPYLPVASAGVMQIDDFGPAVLVLQRDIESGAVALTTYHKRWL